MDKVLITIWYKLRSFANIYFGLHDLFVFFNQIWSDKELLLVATVVLWIIVLRVSTVLYSQFGIRIPFGLPKKHSKVVLRTAYWLTVLASVVNLVHKSVSGIDPIKIIGLVLVYFFILLMDFKETEDIIEKIEKEQP